MSRASHPADATLREGPEFPFGSGKGAGVLSVLCGWLGLGGVVALHFPEYLATPGARAAYPMGLIRGLLGGVILAALAFGLGSIVLGRRKLPAGMLERPHRVGVETHLSRFLASSIRCRMPPPDRGRHRVRDR